MYSFKNHDDVSKYLLTLILKKLNLVLVCNGYSNELFVFKLLAPLKTPWREVDGDVFSQDVCKK